MNVDESALAIFGVFSDIQYADVDDKSYGPMHRRFYRNSVNLMKRAVSEWTGKYPGRMKFILHLGDLIDSQAMMSGAEHKALKTILDAYDEVNKDRVPLYHVWGNHEMYNFERKWLVDSVLNTARILGQNQDTNANYYRVDVTDNLTLLILDFYKFSIIGYNSKDAECKEAYTFLKKYNPNKHLNSTSGLSREHARFVGFNGGLGEQQTKWLDSQLESCEASKRRVIVCGHIPLHRKASIDKAIAWDATEVLEIMRKRPATVLAYLCGHYHLGAYHLDRFGIHHVTFKAILETESGNSYATVYVYPKKVVFVGVGDITSFEVDL